MSSTILETNSSADDEPLYRSFKKVCRLKGFFKEGDRVLVALSGGADSTALVDLAVRWHSEGAPYLLRAAHYHHGLRDESDAELEHVAALCDRLGVECITGRGQVGVEAKQRKISVHAAARDLRYRFLADAALQWAEDSGASEPPVILTGHQLNDQVETVLMRLLSGAGIDGLAGIREREPWTDQSSVVRIVRPLLGFTRDELEEYCRQRKLDYVVDQSNFDLSYPRSRIRLQLLPVLDRLFGTTGFRGILRSTEILNFAREMISTETEKALQDATMHKSSSEIMLDYERFTSYLNMIRFSCIKRAWNNIADRQVRNTFERCKAADAFIHTNGTGSIELGHNVLLSVDDNVIYIYRTPAVFTPVEVHINSGIDIPSWGRLDIYMQPVSECTIPPASNVLYGDCRKTGKGPFIVEPARPGDRIVPFGSSSPRKVTDILREEKIPLHRRGYPIIRNHETIIAIPPFRLAEPFRITSETRQVVVFEFIQDYSYVSIKQEYNG